MLDCLGQVLDCPGQVVGWPWQLLCDSCQVLAWPWQLLFWAGCKVHLFCCVLCCVMTEVFGGLPALGGELTLDDWDGGSIADKGELIVKLSISPKYNEYL